MIIEVSDLLEKLLELRRAGNPRKGVSTGYFGLDELMLLSKQYLMVVTGMPSCGKSEVVDGIAVNTAILHGWNWLYFTPENFPLEEHLKKIVEKKFGKALTSMTAANLKHSAEWAQNHFTWVHPEDDRCSLDAILEDVEIRIEAGHKIDCIVLDPWNELDHSSQSGQRDDQYISKSLTKLRRFHRKHNILTVVVIHPTKMQKDHNGCYPVPTLYDCNGGAMWRNKADFGICVHRSDFSKNEAEVHVQKVKFKTMGKPGKVIFDYDIKSGRFKDQINPEFSAPESVTDLPFID